MGNKQPKYTGKPLLPYVSPMLPTTAAPIQAPAPVAPAHAGPLFNVVVPRYNGPVQAHAQPMRQGQPTRRAVLQIFENKTSE